jgi:MFS transporter, ACS family, tartrate transporter
VEDGTTARLAVSWAAAGIAAVNSIGNLGGYFGPEAFGLLRDHTGSDVGQIANSVTIRVLK